MVGVKSLPRLKKKCSISNCKHMQKTAIIMENVCKSVESIDARGYPFTTRACRILDLPKLKAFPTMFSKAVFQRL